MWFLIRIEICVILKVHFQNFTEQISFADPTVINTNSGSALVFKYEYECQHSKNLLYINSKVLIA